MKKPLLLEIIKYGFPRRAGHTWVEINGIKNNPKAFLIVASHQQKESIDLPPSQVIALSELPKKLWGNLNPRIIDHYALVELVRELCEYYEKKLEELR